MDDESADNTAFAIAARRLDSEKFHPGKRVMLLGYIDGDPTGHEVAVRLQQESYLYDFNDDAASQARVQVLGSSSSTIVVDRYLVFDRPGYDPHSYVEFEYECTKRGWKVYREEVACSVDLFPGEESPINRTIYVSDPQDHTGLTAEPTGRQWLVGIEEGEISRRLATLQEVMSYLQAIRDMHDKK